ncbi:MAG: ABC transporter substrate-binding protein [Alphaproteobacteria bacterium]|nr:ABC transporter substrate-binding protein [Alphaproteobacteria bacterium]
MKRIISGLLLLGAVIFAPLVASAASEITITDIAGRDVRVHVPVKTMILGEGRYLPSLAILDKEDPVRWIAGMMGEFQLYDPATYAQYVKRFPGIKNIPIIGKSGAASFNLEAAIVARPDVAIFGLGGGHGPGARHKDLIDKLDAAGVPVIFIDFRIDPLVNTPKSIGLLATLMGREKEAAEFLAFYTKQLNLVRDRLKNVKERPTVFMESRVGLRDSCCEAIGEQMMGRFIHWAGGKNLLGDKIPGTHGMVSLEYLLVNQPDFYIGTAIGSASAAKKTRSRKSANRIVLGAGADAGLAQASLKHAVQRLGLKQLEAVKSGRAFSIWHHFYNTPMNVAAVQAMAKWLHPSLFQDVSPRQTLEAYFTRFQPFPLDGVYWTALKPSIAGDK